ASHAPPQEMPITRSIEGGRPDDDRAATLVAICLGDDSLRRQLGAPVCTARVDRGSVLAVNAGPAAVDRRAARVDETRNARCARGRDEVAVALDVEKPHFAGRQRVADPGCAVEDDL